MPNKFLPYNDSTDNRIISISLTNSELMRIEFKPYAKTQCSKSYSIQDGINMNHDIIDWLFKGKLPCS